MLKAFPANYFDLASTFTVGDHYGFRLGVNNIFDKQPPIGQGSALRVEHCARSVQRQHLSGHLGRARPVHLRRRDAELLSRTNANCRGGGTAAPFFLNPALSLATVALREPRVNIGPWPPAPTSTTSRRTAIRQALAAAARRPAG